MERRTVLILAVPAGLVVGAALWLVAGGAGTSAKVEALQARLAALPRPRAAALRSGDVFAAQVLATPIFDVAGGSLREIAVKLEGVARTPGRAAALLSINGAPAMWLELGQSLGGITLQELSGSSATIDTPMGVRDLLLGASIGAPPAAAAAPAGPPPPSDQPPPGYKGPPPPASAPGVAP